MKRLQAIAAGAACGIEENKPTNSSTMAEWLELKSVPDYMYWYILPKKPLTFASKPKHIYPTRTHDTHQNANAVQLINACTVLPKPHPHILQALMLQIIDPKEIFPSIHLLGQIRKSCYELWESRVLTEDGPRPPAVPVILIRFISHEVDSPLSGFFMTTN